MEVAGVDDRSRTDELEARISDLEQRLRSSDSSGGGSRRAGIETAFWAMMREVFPQETRRHMKAAGREQLMAARSYLDHWIAKLDEQREAATPEREQIAIE
jgi:BMFP domain-containing protein YqiC